MGGYFCTPFPSLSFPSFPQLFAQPVGICDLSRRLKVGPDLGAALVVAVPHAAEFFHKKDQVQIIGAVLCRDELVAPQEGAETLDQAVQCLKLMELIVDLE